MGKYLELGNSGVEEIIDGVIDEIVSALRPRSVTILGSFGRNEVSFFEDKGKLTFLSDCEISTICNRYVSRRTLRKLATRIYQRTGLEIVLSNSVILLLYSKFRIPSPVAQRMWRPTIVNYERSEGARVVYGENILERMPKIEADDIPVWEGIRLMFNRMVEALRYFPIGQQGREESIYWINKVIFACQDVLLLSIKQYHYSYKERNIRFQQVFPKYFSELNKMLPKFLDLATKATEYKLSAGTTHYPEDLTGLWFNVAEICDTIFTYIIKKDMNIVFDSYEEFQERYLKHPGLKGKYYLGVIASPIFHNIVTGLKITGAGPGRFPSVRLALKLRTPWQHIVYSLIPLVYFGLSRDGEVNMPLVRQARDTLLLFKKLNPQNQSPLEEWGYIKDETINLWQRLCG